jgi:hypothetical protein
MTMSTRGPVIGKGKEQGGGEEGLICGMAGNGSLSWVMMFVI